MTESEHQTAFLNDLAEWLLMIRDCDRGWRVTGGELWRNSAMQRCYQQAGLSWTSKSWHLRRTAFDFNLFVDGQYVSGGNHPAFDALHGWWESLSPYNHTLGPRDANHIERRRTPRSGHEVPGE